VCVCIYVCVCACVYMCVCVRERERERERSCYIRPESKPQVVNFKNFTNVFINFIFISDKRC